MAIDDDNANDNAQQVSAAEVVVEGRWTAASAKVFSQKKMSAMTILSSEVIEARRRKKEREREASNNNVLWEDDGGRRKRQSVWDQAIYTSDSTVGQRASKAKRKSWHNLCSEKSWSSCGRGERNSVCGGKGNELCRGGGGTRGEVRRGRKRDEEGRGDYATSWGRETPMRSELRSLVSGEHGRKIFTTSYPNWRGTEHVNLPREAPTRRAPSRDDGTFDTVSVSTAAVRNRSDRQRHSARQLGTPTAEEEAAIRSSLPAFAELRRRSADNGVAQSFADLPVPPDILEVCGVARTSNTRLHIISM